MILNTEPTRSYLYFQAFRIRSDVEAGLSCVRGEIIQHQTVLNPLLVHLSHSFSELFQFRNRAF